MKAPATPIAWNNGNFGPKGYFPYLVQTGDNWDNVATRDGRTYVWDLIRDNFQTDDPMEVNWYLKNYVGCTVTKDGKNYSFDSTDAVKMTDGTSRRGRIFTKKDLRGITPAPPDDHDQLRQGMLAAINANSGLIFNLEFSMFGFDLYGSNYRVIRDYLRDRKVGCKYDGSIPADEAEYDSHHDLFIFRKKTFTGPSEVGHLVHELTHAVCDDREASFLNKRESEAIAYVAQCLYVLKRSGVGLEDTPKMKEVLPTDTAAERQAKYKKFGVGSDIAKKIKAGALVVHEDDEDRMLWAMKNAHEGTGPARYNGIERKMQF